MVLQANKIMITTFTSGVFEKDGKSYPYRQMVYLEDGKTRNLTLKKDCILPEGVQIGQVIMREANVTCEYTFGKLKVISIKLV